MCSVPFSPFKRAKVRVSFEQLYAALYVTVSWKLAAALKNPSLLVKHTSSEKSS